MTQAEQILELALMIERLTRLALELKAQAAIENQQLLDLAEQKDAQAVGAVESFLAKVGA